MFSNTWQSDFSLWREDRDVPSLLSSPEGKRGYVRELFETIAPAYDRFTRWFSYGMDPRWKRELVSRLAPRINDGAVVVDLACGSGDLGLSLKALRPTTLVLGLDLSRRMLRLARDRDPSWPLCLADMTDLPLPDRSADAVLAGYAFRNSPSLGRAVEEAARVLKPEGWLATLEFYLPRQRLWRRVFVGYLRLAGRLYERLWDQSAGSYTYIAESLGRFLTAADFPILLERSGFRVVGSREKLGGGIALHWAQRAT